MRARLSLIRVVTGILACGAPLIVGCLGATQVGSSAVSTGAAALSSGGGVSSTGAASSSTGTGSGTASGTASGGSSTGTSGAGSSGGTTGASSSGTTTGSPTCPLAVTNPMFIDGFAGLDSPCCGSSMQLACHSLTQAMANIAAAKLSDAELLAYMSNGAPDWTGPEVWPVVLHEGVALSAAGIFFANRGSTPADLFHVARNTNESNDPVSINGLAGNPVRIGFNSSYVAAGTLAAVSVMASSRLDLQDAALGGPTGLAIGAPGTEQGSVNFGPDPVQIGDLAHKLTGAHGVVCAGATGNAPSLLSDNLATAPTLFVEGQVTDVTVDSHCNIDMSRGIILGPAPVAGICPAKLDQTGLDVRGNGIVQADLITVQCQAGDGVFVELGDDAGSPFVDLNAATLAHNGCAGFHMLAGQCSLSTTAGPTLVESNNYGVRVEGGFFLGAVGATLACNAGAEPGNCRADVGAGVDLWQEGSKALVADQVTWATDPPASYTCGAAFASCSWGSTAPAEADIVVFGDAGAVSAATPALLDGGCP